MLYPHKHIQMAEVRVNEEQIISAKHFVLKNINFDILKKDGKWQTQNREVFDHGNAVAVLLYNKEQRTVILTKQFRIATYINGNATGMLTEACAGLLEGDEDPEDAVIREIKEETGYHITHVEKVYEAYSSAGSLTELLYLYIAEYASGQQKGEGGGLAEEGEEINVLEMSFDEATDMMEKGEIRDAKTIILLQYLKLKKVL